MTGPVLRGEEGKFEAETTRKTGELASVANASASGKPKKPFYQERKPKKNANSAKTDDR